MYKKLLPFGVALVVLGVMAGTDYFTAGPAFAKAPDPKPNEFPSWDKTFDAGDRFEVVLGGAGVLDHETGLVWEQSPDTTQRPWELVFGNPINARFHCANRATGGRKGWRLPSFYELAGLVDPLNPTGDPDLPPGHPFSNVQSDFYWSSTRNARVPDQPFTVRFLDGSVASAFFKTTNFFVWCVRGGSPGPGVY